MWKCAGYQTLGQEYVDSFMALEHRTENGARVAPMTVGARTLLVAIRTAMVYCAQRSEAIQQLLSASLRRISSRWHGALRRVNGDRLLGLFTFVANVHLLYFFANGRYARTNCRNAVVQRCALSSRPAFRDFMQVLRLRDADSWRPHAHEPAVQNTAGAVVLPEPRACARAAGIAGISVLCAAGVGSDSANRSGDGS